jgi:hypothetical protein
VVIDRPPPTPKRRPGAARAVQLRGIAQVEVSGGRSYWRPWAARCDLVGSHRWWCGTAENMRFLLAPVLAHGRGPSGHPPGHSGC